MVQKTKTAVEARRKWCIEQAIRWPQVNAPSLHYAGAAGAAQAVYGQYQSAYVDADVIGRAKKIEAYLNEK